jgi:uncharacterized protein (DUF885 family)
MKRVKRLAKWLSLSLLSMLLLLAAFGLHTWYFKPVSIDLFYGRVFAAFALDNPEMLSTMRIVPPPLDFYSDELDDISETQAARLDRMVNDARVTLQSYDRNDLSREGRLSYDVLAYYLKMRAEGEQFRLHDFPVNQFDNIHTATFDFLVNVHDVETLDDGRNYIARLEKIPHKFGQALDGLKLREAKGMLPPRFAVEKVIEQLAVLMAQSPRESPLYLSLDKKLAAGAIEPAQRAALLAQAEGAISGKVVPSLRTLHDWFVAVLPKALNNDGAWSLPGGDAHYAYAVRYYTSTDMTPQQIHELGLAEVARISTEMDAMLQQQGLAKGTVGERMQQLGSAPEQRYGNTAQDKKAMIAQYQAILDEADREIGKAFDRRPKLGVEVRAVPEYAQATSAGAYYAVGSFDGSRPGVFFANMRAPGDVPKFSMRTIAYHEGIPGHHFQVAIAQEIEDVPFFRNVIDFPAYSEGWALYGERLAYELGFGKAPLDQLGRLRDEMMRATRLVVDSGIHYKRWSREQAIAYMVEHTGMAEREVSAEVERYMVTPGQVLAYKVGMMKIMALREHARQQLGDKFDLKQFHNEVLTHGALPLTVLEGVIKDWIATRKKT